MKKHLVIVVRVLIVEDEPIFRMDLLLRLKRMGVEDVTETALAAQSIKLAHDSTFDLVLMDVHLKDSMSGLEAASQICRESGVPIVVMSAYALDEEEIRTDVPSLVRFLSKPISDGAIAQIVEGMTA